MKEIEFIKKILNEAVIISKKEYVATNKDAEWDIVTNLDVEIENYLISEIKKEYPKFDIVSEENNSKNNVTSNCFIIDPIDGTINFANNLPLWGIQIACVKNNKTIAAAIYMPRINEYYWADETGAYLNNALIKTKQVPIKNALYAVDGNNNLPSMERLRKYSSNRRNFGGVCVSMAFVAAGRIHGAVFRSDKAWDYEPGLFIAKMAGAAIESKNGFHACAMNKEFLDILELETAKNTKSSNIFVLHSLNGDTINYWGKDVKSAFGAKDIDVFLPEFPIRELSSYEKFEEILKTYLDNGKLSNNSIVVAHSIGNAYFIRFCNKFSFVPKAYISVAPGAIYKYPSTRFDYIVKVKEQAYLNDLELKYVKNNLINKICLYSNEDDGNLEKFTRFIEDTNSEAIYLAGYNHFDGYHRIYQIPELNERINKLI